MPWRQGTPADKGKDLPNRPKDVRTISTFWTTVLAMAATAIWLADQYSFHNNIALGAVVMFPVAMVICYIGERKAGFGRKAAAFIAVGVAVGSSALLLIPLPR